MKTPGRCLPVLLLALVMAGCTAPEGAPDQRWAENDDFLEQPRLAAMAADMPDESGWTPATLDWRPYRDERLKDLEADSAEALTEQVIQRLDFRTEVGEGLILERRRRSMPDGGTEAILLRWGLHDDAIAGHDIHLRLAERGGRWQIREARERWHCRRGISEEGLCL